ncbi:hypothetical protein QFZ75_004407 [Streptomyces sp. V3I8]|uniref:hypothetical protein n=1 Tax=Streptomyces sp. V3I8 TaxID=3042279 RepID=UPI002781C13C|nr:hypothetical protein [Streptomyces sp. V3I8]MDQ1037991.1 hypothetical protein [Streptomyces sp. V3I8]
MSDLIPALIPWLSFQLAALGLLLSLARTMEPATGGGRHRKGDAVPNRVRIPRRGARGAEVPLDGNASRLVRPYLPKEFCLTREAEAA